ncbi:MAG: ribonuclease D [Planctomycetes bacterium]|nr:ribonuclease D [Planctomycetota bacterium]
MQDTRQEPLYVETPESLRALLDSIDRSELVVIDTEFIPEETYEPRLCLVQIGTTEGIGIVDAVALPELGDLWKTLTDPARELVALGARQEIIFCLRGAGRPPARFFELQIAAGLLGYGYPLSHTKLIHRVLGVQVKGGESFTDWRKRPLSPKQLRYAADDVRYLRTARDRLMEEAKRKGRGEWIVAECRRFVERVVASDQEEAWRRVSGSSGLDARESAILRELWRWRDEKARAADRPARRILPDHLVIGIARRRPTKLEDLYALRGMERISIRKAGPEILEAVQRGVAMPEAECPPVARRVDPPQVATLAQLLAAVTQTLAIRHGVEPTLLATSADLQDLVRWRIGLHRSTATPWILEGWRGAILQPLLELLDGKRAIRIADARSRNPIALEENGAAS